MKKIISILIMVLVFATGCSSDSDNNSTVKELTEGQGGDLTVWSFSETAITQTDIFEKWYEETYDQDINIDVTIIPYGDFVGKLSLALQNGTGPDLFFVEIGHIGQLLSKGADLVQDLNAAPFTGSTLVEDNVQYTTDAVSGENGELYGVTAQASPMGIFYRLDIAEKIGYSEDDVNKAFQTKEGTIKLCDDLAANDYYCMSSIEDVEFFYPFFTTRPVDDETGQISEEYLDGVQIFYNDLQTYFEKGYISPYLSKSTEWQQQLHIADPSEAKVFAMNNATWAVSKYLANGEEEDGGSSTYGSWRFTTAPTATFNGGSWYMMNKDAKNPSLAWEFLQFYATNDDFATEYSKEKVDYYSSYNRQEKFHDQQNSDFLGGQNLYDIVGDSLEEIDVDGYTSEYDILADTTVVSVALDVKAGNIKPEDAISTVIEQIQTAAPELTVPEKYKE